MWAIIAPNLELTLLRLAGGAPTHRDTQHHSLAQMGKRRKLLHRAEVPIRQPTVPATNDPLGVPHLIQMTPCRKQLHSARQGKAKPGQARQTDDDHW
mmetsp:Transcript_52816/g.115447  ORF Transcript_52816/g.115447 Transcript_52816/m.115447 type:complete len:97 (+) Transcript_52816:57-347(+)